MNEQQGNQHIRQHYHKENLMEQIKAELARHDRSLSSLNLEDLAAFDELHIGGKNASRLLAEKAELVEKNWVLDVGAGIGGPARMLAHEFGLNVVGLDLTESFCQVATQLSNAVGIEGVISFVNGNALQLPFKSASFDAIWSQHCSMNIKDKQVLYSELWRILKPKGKLLIHDVVAGEQHPVQFPVPWASAETFSFLNNAAESRSIIAKAGFLSQHWQDITNQALAWYDSLKQRSQNAKIPVLNQKLVFGDSLKEMAKNMKMNLRENRIRVVEAIWVK